MHPELSFEQAPPISVPFRFFLTAPWFGVAAGLLLVLTGPEIFSSRWMPSTLAATHLLVAGFMLQAMCGALMQFVPVAAGGNIWRPRLTGAIVHSLLVAATILLVTAFLTQRPSLFIAATHAFVIGVGVFCLVVGIALWRTPATGATIVALRIALIGLLVTLGLGTTLAIGLARGSSLPLKELTDLHAAWGLGGWALVLLAGVSYFVVPMFQLTPAYPAWLARGLPLALLPVLLLWSWQFADAPETTRMALWLSGLGIAAAYAAETLYLQSRRRRKVRDVTLAFFRLAMLCLLALLVSGLAMPDPVLWMGVLAIVGVFMSAISGMLYKIMPFLCWLHLQRLCALNTLPPTINQMLAEPAMRRQYHAHRAALLLLLAAVWVPQLARPAGLALAVSCGWLGWNLLQVVRAYLRFKDRIRATA
jgi:hypothetical protein